MKRQLLPLLLLAVFWVSSCLENTVRPEEASIGSDPGNIRVQAEFVPGSGADSVALIISANRNWFAHLNDPDNPITPDKTLSWASLSLTDHINTTGSAEETVVIVSFQRNKKESGRNAVLEIWMEGEIRLKVPVLQDGAVFHLDASASASEIECQGGDVTLSVDCNTDWTAEIAASSTGSATLSDVGGYDPAQITLTVDENTSLTDKKQIDVVFKTAGGLTKTVSVSQKTAVPYVSLISAAENKVTPLVDSMKITFKTNCPWTAEVIDATLQNASLDKTSGAGALEEQNITLNFTHNSSGDPMASQGLKVKIKVEGVEKPVEVSCTQTGALKVDFAGTFTPAIPTATGWAGSPATFSFTVGQQQYSIIISSNYTILVDKLLDFRGNSTKSYITFPGISGLKLVRIIGHFTYNKSCNFFSGQLKTDDFPSADAKNLSEYIDFFKYDSDYDLVIEVGTDEVKPETGRGCTLLAGSSKSNCRPRVNSFELVYE